LFNHEQIQALLTATPFVPFRLHLSDGGLVDIRHRELALPGQRFIFVGLPDPEHPNRPFDRFQLVYYMHVSRVEALAPGAPPFGPPPASPPSSPSPTPVR
jgi:hypothetical protein